MRTGQRGAALPLGIALLLCGTLGGFVLYNTGQSATDKARVVNAADAASYSGLVWQARALNFQAYTNRAMVANQVSMAQAVTLRSWASYGAITTQNMELVLGKIPYIGPIFIGAARVMEGVNRVVEPVADVMLGAVNAVNAGLRHAQTAMFVSSFAATPEIISAVVESSDPRFTADTAFSVVGVLGNLDEWRGFTRSVGTDDVDGMRARAELVRGSQGEFTKERDWELLPVDFHLLVASFNVDREGETRLVESMDADGNLVFEWKAKDTVSLDLGHWSWRKGWDHTDVPIGWAEAYANSIQDERTIEEGACTSERDFFQSLSPFGDGRDCERWLDRNENAERLADAGVRFGRTESRVSMNAYQGINPFRDLSEDAIEEDFPTMRLKVEVALPADGVRSSDALGSGGDFRTGYRTPGDVLTSVSVAEVFFKPPMADREGGGIEFANAYSPWWDVRLAPVSEADRMLAFAGRDHRSTELGGTRAPGVGGGGAGSLEEWDGTGGAAGERSIADAVGGIAEAARAAGADDTIREALVGAIEDAATGILAGLLERRAGIGSRDDLEAWVGEQSGIDVAGARATYEDSRAEVDAIQGEIDRVRDLLETEIRDLVLERIGEAFGTEAGLLDALGDPAALEADKAAARERLGELEGRLVRELGREIVERVEAVTDVFELPETMARQHVRMMIKALREELAETPDWVPFGADPIRDAGTGPGPGDGTEPAGGAGEGPARGSAGEPADGQVAGGTS